MADVARVRADIFGEEEDEDEAVLARVQAATAAAAGSDEDDDDDELIAAVQRCDRSFPLALVTSRFQGQRRGGGGARYL